MPIMQVPHNHWKLSLIDSIREFHFHDLIDYFFNWLTLESLYISIYRCLCEVEYTTLFKIGAQKCQHSDGENIL